MISSSRIGILGGTLDPIHLGHVDVAMAARDALGLERLLLVPSHVPPHRPQQPVASAFHRFAMAALAANDIEGLEASDLELTAPGPSYTADTLARLHASGFTPAQIFFITGADAFAEIATWSRYPHVLDLAHFVVVSRPGYPASAIAERLPALSARISPISAGNAEMTGTRIFPVHSHTSDVSSTEVRARLRDGRPVRDMLPAGVERHIRKHGLYMEHGSSKILQSTADHLHGRD